METSDVTMRGFNCQNNHSTKTVQFQILYANDSERFNCQHFLVVEDFQLPKLKAPNSHHQEVPPFKRDILDNTR